MTAYDYADFWLGIALLCAHSAGTIMYQLWAGRRPRSGGSGRGKVR